MGDCANICSKVNSVVECPMAKASLSKDWLRRYNGKRMLAVCNCVAISYLPPLRLHSSLDDLPEACSDTICSSNVRRRLVGVESLGNTIASIAIALSLRGMIRLRFILLIAAGTMTYFSFRNSDVRIVNLP